MKPSTFSVLLLMVLTFAIVGCGKAPVPATPPQVVALAPEEICTRGLQVLKSLLAPNTKVQREDDEGGITFRFTVRESAQEPIRMVEVRIARQAESAGAEVSVRAERFSFLGSAKRDQADAQLEDRIGQLLASLPR